MDPTWIRATVEETAAELGRLRRQTRNTPYAWRVDLLCDRIWYLLSAVIPTAADLYRQTGDIDAALSAIDQETRRLARLLHDETTP